MGALSIGIGGAAGDGLARCGDILARTGTRLGLHAYAYNSYQSVIRGGHIWLTLRMGEDKVRSHGDHLNLLIALNQDTLERHAPQVEAGGWIVYAADRLTCPERLPGKDVNLLGMPVKELLKPLGKVPPVMQNSVLVGAAAHLLGLDPAVLEGVTGDIYAGKPVEVIAHNVDATRAGHAHARQHTAALNTGWAFSRTARPFLTGNQAMALGALAAGCKFYAAYPMTPVSNILHYLAAHGPDFGMVVKQCEDEIAVIHTAIGAGYAGVRAMCATSGGGFALMSEAVGFAGMIEAPVVIVEGQRAGPSTGVPTKTEQGDLNQVFGASQGDYPRAILAPVDTADAFGSVAEAFNLAERFQMPVIVMSDLALAEHYETVEHTDLDWDMPIDRGERVDDVAEADGYLRYRLTPSGVSPRALPGTPRAAHIAASDEHDEAGILLSDVFASPPMRRKMHEKRMRKLEAVAAQLPPPERYGASRPEVLLIGWGSTGGVIREAVDLLSERGVVAGQMQVKYLLPFPTGAMLEAIDTARRTVVVENNLTGQFARYLRAETGHRAHGLVLRYDGEPFTPGYIAERAQAVLTGRSQPLALSEGEARECAYHYIRSRLGDMAWPATLRRVGEHVYGEPAWEARLEGRDDGHDMGLLVIGADTGAVLALHHPIPRTQEAAHGHA
ncbi:MAG: 2-oxoacid:acceptor oxidoreductase subunit alpha [Nitrospirae bacterium]|nr:2-oxoacid:acceptor oxidoreductase subunit alpha [Nitrospirota bacterium]